MSHSGLLFFLPLKKVRSQSLESETTFALCYFQDLTKFSFGAHATVGDYAV